MKAFFNFYDPRDVVKKIFSNPRILELLKSTLEERAANVDADDCTSVYTAGKYQQLVKEGKLGQLHQVTMSFGLLTLLAVLGY
jgi:hypothetical protein